MRDISRFVPETLGGCSDDAPSKRKRSISLPPGNHIGKSLPRLPARTRSSRGSRGNPPPIAEIPECPPASHARLALEEKPRGGPGQKILVVGFGAGWCDALLLLFEANRRPSPATPPTCQCSTTLRAGGVTEKSYEKSSCPYRSAHADWWEGDRKRIRRRQHAARSGGRSGGGGSLEVSAPACGAIPFPRPRGLRKLR